MPSAESGAGSGTGPMFVVHRHDATRLHYDVRLEIDGALVSWAVPKGPSMNPADKRLAVRVDDHELEYGGFEGVNGRYPSGHVGTTIVWDFGWLSDASGSGGKRMPAGEALAAGHLSVVLHGQRLGGAFAVTHAKLGGDDRNWLLVKTDDDAADRDTDVLVDVTSVVTGRTNEDWAAEAD